MYLGRQPTTLALISLVYFYWLNRSKAIWSRDVIGPTWYPYGTVIWIYTYSLRRWHNSVVTWVRRSVDGCKYLLKYTIYLLFVSQSFCRRHGLPAFFAFLFGRRGAVCPEVHGLLYAFHGSLLFRYAAFRERPIRAIRFQQVWISGWCQIRVVRPGASRVPGTLVFGSLDFICEDLCPAQSADYCYVFLPLCSEVGRLLEFFAASCNLRCTFCFSFFLCFKPSAAILSLPQVLHLPVFNPRWQTDTIRLLCSGFSFLHL